MPIDSTQFPLVFLRLDEGADGSSTTSRSTEDQLDSVLGREQRFVLIAARAPGGDQDGSPEERKQRALFFKRNRERLRRLCAGAVVVEGDRPTPVAIRLAAQAMGKAFGFSFQFVATEFDAIDRARQLVGRAVSGNSG